MRIRKEDAENFTVDGIELHKYVQANRTNPADVLHVSVEDDHEREFSNSQSHFIYYVISGEGKFWVDGEKTEAKPMDVIHIEPGDRIYYRGEMEMLLVTTPPYDESNDTYYGIGKDKY